MAAYGLVHPLLLTQHVGELIDPPTTSRIVAHTNLCIGTSECYKSGAGKDNLGDVSGPGKAESCRKHPLKPTVPPAERVARI